MPGELIGDSFSQKIYEHMCSISCIPVEPSLLLLTPFATSNNEIPLISPLHGGSFNQPLLLGLAPLLGVLCPPRSPPVPDCSLPGQGLPQCVQGDGRLGDAGGGLIPDAPQGLHAAGIDGLDVAHKVQLGPQGPEHAVLLGTVSRGWQGGQAQEVVQGGRGDLLR